jgi:putative tryptophan/tyrosine transport system substrate-binding protein
MDRRAFIGTLTAGLLAAPLAAEAQPAGKVWRVGILGNENSAPWEAFRRGLRDLGYVGGRNLTMESRWSEGRTERLPALAIELVQLRVDVIVASGTQAVRAAKQATSTIPIVMAVSAHPDKIGLVESLARPGGNVTGLDNVGPDLKGKQLQLLKEVAPKVSRVAVLPSYRARRATSPSPRFPRSRKRTPTPWACGTSSFAAPAHLFTRRDAPSAP